VEPQPQQSSAHCSASGRLGTPNDLLDEVGDDIQQQNLIAQWFEQLGEERDRKLDAYTALITEMTRAAIRQGCSGCRTGF